MPDSSHFVILLGCSGVWTTRAATADDDTLIRPSAERLPGHALTLSLEHLWQEIQTQKDLNLPAHKARQTDGLARWQMDGRIRQVEGQPGGYGL
jgi:hypothetical protein